VTKTRAAVITLIAVAAFGLTRARTSGQADSHQHDEHAHAAAAEAMSHHDHGHGPGDPHMKMTALRPVRVGDRERAEAILKTLRGVLEPYRDAARAERDGYQPFLPQLPLPEHHFTNWRYGFIGAFTFDPEKPTSLLYRRSGGTYTLAGAMYTAPARATEQQLDARIPLSIGRWHLHVNICQPPRGEPRPDLGRFWFKGSIATKAECDAAGGRFRDQMFGWMIHVYPYETDPNRIWTH
jgi:hypothetical protein